MSNNKKKGTTSLNPCFSGRYAGRHHFQDKQLRHTVVLILVFREDMLGARNDGVV